ncbi:MAG: hypothetical protein U9N02_00670 [Campylobacterota bacterium]|nr:hypothetical protein [Campylobacterota bacterium]
MKLTIDEYSKKFNMTKESVNLKIKEKKIKSIIENNVEYILVKSAKVTVSMVIELYQKENHLLKNKIEQLEKKIDKLVDDKEQMLINEKNKIETIYTDRDKQLKNVLELINTKIMLENKQEKIHDVQTFEITNEKKEENTEFVELKKYLKTLDLTPKQRKKIKEKFKKICNSDIRIIQQNGKIYLDFSKYDYSDLLKY